MRACGGESGADRVLIRVDSKNRERRVRRMEVAMSNH